MLVHLAIHDLAIIEAAELELGRGLNVLTGETGAGKSIVAGALGLILGDRARTDAIRRGAERAEVQALFLVEHGSETARALAERELLPERGIEDEGPVELVVRRIIRRTGRGRAYVNGVLVTVQTLAELTRGLVDLASQHEHTRLMDASTHLGLLDAFGEHEEVLEDWRGAWRALVEARREHAALLGHEEGRLAREDYLRFQVEELERVAPRVGEDEGLGLERERLVHAESLRQGTRESEAGLAGREGSAQDQLIGAVRTLDRLAAVDPDLAPLVERLESLRIEVDDVAYELRRYAEGVEVDPRRLDMVEERLEALRRLKRKHAMDLEGLAVLAEELRAELDGFERLDEDLAAAVERREACYQRALAAGQALSAARSGAARALETLVDAELGELAMGGASLRFDLHPREGDEPLGPSGADAGTLLVETNRGEGFRPLHKVASGGELSRLLLAFKCVVTRADDVATAIFDEVDAGVGGAIAEAIGQKLRSAAADRQVIVITHLAQVAAQADHHLVVAKASTEGGRTTTSVRALPSAQRAGEIARMLGGAEITDKTRAHAQEMLDTLGPRTSTSDAAFA